MTPQEIHDREHVARVDGCAFGKADFFDDAVFRRFHFVLHLHRFERGDLVPLRDFAADARAQGRDHAEHIAHRSVFRFHRGGDAPRRSLEQIRVGDEADALVPGVVSRLEMRVDVEIARQLRGDTLAQQLLRELGSAPAQLVEELAQQHVLPARQRIGELGRQHTPQRVADGVARRQRGGLARGARLAGAGGAVPGRACPSRCGSASSPRWWWCTGWCTSWCGRRR